MTPVPSFPVFSRLYRFLSGRRKTLFAATAFLIALGGAALRNIEIREDIESMLPDDTSDVARDFRLLQSAPFTRKILITLTGGPRTEPAALLSERELEVLACLAEGLTTLQIAMRLFISENTVKTHIRHILEKMEASNRTEAVGKATQLGLIRK